MVLGNSNFFSYLQQWAPLSVGDGRRVCKAGGDVGNANTEYVSGSYAKIQASPS